jgi:hypothetical protein
MHFFSREIWSTTERARKEDTIDAVNKIISDCVVEKLNKDSLSPEEISQILKNYNHISFKMRILDWINESLGAQNNLEILVNIDTIKLFNSLIKEALVCDYNNDFKFKSVIAIEHLIKNGEDINEFKKHIIKASSPKNNTDLWSRCKAVKLLGNLDKVENERFKICTDIIECFGTRRSDEILVALDAFEDQTWWDCQKHPEIKDKITNLVLECDDTHLSLKEENAELQVITHPDWKEAVGSHIRKSMIKEERRKIYEAGKNVLNAIVSKN